MKPTIENIIKKNLPEKKEMSVVMTATGQEKPVEYKVPNTEWNDCLSQIDTKLIADEVLKVVVEKIKKLPKYPSHPSEDYEEAIEDVLELLSHLSPNKENKNNEKK